MIIADGIEYLPFLKLMRDMKPMPILVLSTKYDASEKLEAIQCGADEYYKRLAYDSRPFFQRIGIYMFWR